MRQIQTDRVGGRPLADDDIERKILHGRIKHFLHTCVQPVDFIDEKHISRSEICEDRGKVASMRDRRAARYAQISSHLVGNDRGKRGLSKARRAI